MLCVKELEFIFWSMSMMYKWQALLKEVTVQQTAENKMGGFRMLNILECYSLAVCARVVARSCSAVSRLSLARGWKRLALCKENGAMFGNEGGSRASCSR
eukprot:m.184946 g.184946  ORF g.184946 m.184946 type:complete len:100 (+) comp32212_c0_seq11:218-517(+)